MHGHQKAPVLLAGHLLPGKLVQHPVAHAGRQPKQHLLPFLRVLLLLVQGLCLIRWYVEYRRYPRILLPLSLLLTFTLPIASQLVVVLGAYEMVFDLRKIRKPDAKKPE